VGVFGEVDANRSSVGNSLLFVRVLDQLSKDPVEEGRSILFCLCLGQLSAGQLKRCSNIFEKPADFVGSTGDMGNRFE
jgi:hypothetical protein